MAENQTTLATGLDKPRPQTPPTGAALTEYSVNPSTPTEEKRERLKKVVPPEYLGDDGYPDVRSANQASFCAPIVPVPDILTL